MSNTRQSYVNFFSFNTTNSPHPLFTFLAQKQRLTFCVQLCLWSSSVLNSTCLTTKADQLWLSHIKIREKDAWQASCDLTFYETNKCIQVTHTSKIYYSTSSHDSTLCVSGVTSTSNVRASVKVFDTDCRKMRSATMTWYHNIHNQLCTSRRNCYLESKLQF